MDEKLLPPGIPTSPAPEAPAAFAGNPPKVPSVKQQSWGAVLSIALIVLMVIIGAFYAWGKRVAEEHALTSQTSGS